MTNELVIATDLGGTHLRAAVIDRTGRILNRVKIQTPKAESADEIVRAIVGAARSLIEEMGGQGSLIRALLVAVPGTVNFEEGVVMRAPNIPSLDGFRLGAALAGETPLKVLLENDSNAAAVGEMWQGAARGRGTIICLTLGTGVGGGIILNKELWRGIDGTAAEVGHIVVEPVGAPCGCGGRGCLEVYASATAIVRQTREMLPRYSGSPLRTMEGLTAVEVFRHGQAGDELAREVFRRVGFYLGVGLTSLINLINPEMIVIGGGAAAGWDLFYEHMREQIMTRAFAVPARRAEIVQAQCGDDAGILGGAHLAFISLDKSRSPAP